MTFLNIRGILGNLFTIGKGSSQVNLTSDNGILQACDNGGPYVPIVKSHSEISQPMGFVSRLDSSISFNNSTRTFTISPLSNHYVIYNPSSSRIIKSSTESVVLPNTTNGYYIYFDGSNILQYTTVWSTAHSNVQVAYVYYSTVSSTGYLGDERHVASMDNPTLVNLQQTDSLLYGGGLNISGYILNSDTIQGITFALSQGSVIAEDIVFNISNLTQPVNNPVFYRTGTSGDWIAGSATGYPFLTNGNYVAYNRFDGTQWLQTPMPNNNYVSYWLVATNSPQYPLIVVQGQSTHSTLTDARMDRLDTLNLGTAPFSQAKLLYHFIFQSSSNYNPSSYYTKMVNLVDLRNNIYNDINEYSPISHCSINNTDLYGHPASTNYSDTYVVASGTTQSLANSSYTTISFPTKTTDLANEFGTTTYTSARRQLVYAYFIGTVTSFPSSKDMIVRILKNSTVVCSRISSSVGGGNVTLSASVLIPISQGDTMTVQVYNGSRGSVNMTDFNCSYYSAGGIKI